jgi:hypothetical protein
MTEKGDRQMRVIRTILGMLMLTIGLPALLGGAGLWAAMQHRDAGGAFSGALQRVSTPGYAVVVDDLDALLRADAPFVRVGDTRLRLTATTTDGPAFIGIAPAARATDYLTGVPHASVYSVDLGTGALPVAAHRVTGSVAPATLPGAETFWTKAGAGALDFDPATLANGPYSLVVMSRGAQPGLRLEATAELRPRWLNSATWGLLMLGSLLVMGGMLVLAWPGRRREIVYVVEPSQVPELMKRIGAPLPLARTGGGRHAAAHRPRTLADAQPKVTPPALPQFSWPPVKSGSGAVISPDIANFYATGAAATTAAPAPAGAPAPAAASAAPAPAVASAVATAEAPQTVPDAATAAAAAAASSEGAVPAASAAPTASAASTAAAGPPPPPPGQPLNLIGGGSAATAAAVRGDGPATVPEPLFGRTTTDRASRRRAATPQPSDTPVFEASAVGAWVAETSATRAREAEARAAAARAAAAARSAEAARIAEPRSAEPRTAETQGDAVAAISAPSAAAASPASGAADRAATPAAGPRRSPQFPAVTGPAVTDWSATGLTRADSPRVGAAGQGQRGPRPAQHPAAAPASAPAAASATSAAPAPAPAAPAPVAAPTAPAASEPTASATSAASAASSAAATGSAREITQTAATHAAATPGKTDAARSGKADPAKPGKADAKEGIGSQPAAEAIKARDVDSPADSSAAVSAAASGAEASVDPHLADETRTQAATGKAARAGDAAEARQETAEKATPAGSATQDEKVAPPSRPAPAVPGPAGPASAIPASATSADEPTEAATRTGRKSAPGQFVPSDQATARVRPSTPSTTTPTGGTGGAATAPSPSGVGATTTAPAPTRPASPERPAVPSPARPANPPRPATTEPAAASRPGATVDRSHPGTPVQASAHQMVPPRIADLPDAGAPRDDLAWPPVRTPEPAGTARPLGADRTARRVAELERSADRLGDLGRAHADGAVRTGPTSTRAERDSTERGRPGGHEQSERRPEQLGEPDEGTGQVRDNGAGARLDGSGGGRPQADPRTGTGDGAAKPAPDRSARTGTATTDAGGTTPTPASADAEQGQDRPVSSARLAGYQEEAAQLLAGDAAARRKRRTTASGLPAPDPAGQEPPIKVTRPPRRGQSRPPAKD